MEEEIVGGMQLSETGIAGRGLQESQSGGGCQKQRRL